MVGGVIPTGRGRDGLFQKQGAQLLAKIFPGKIDFSQTFPKKQSIQTQPLPNKNQDNSLKNNFYHTPPKIPHRYYFSKKFLSGNFQIFQTFTSPLIKVHLSLKIMNGITLKKPIFPRGVAFGTKGTTFAKNISPYKNGNFCHYL